VVLVINEIARSLESHDLVSRSTPESLIYPLTSIPIIMHSQISRMTIKCLYIRGPDRGPKEGYWDLVANGGCTLRNACTLRTHV